MSERARAWIEARLVDIPDAEVILQTLAAKARAMPGVHERIELTVDEIRDFVDACVTACRALPPDLAMFLRARLAADEFAHARRTGRMMVARELHGDMRDFEYDDRARFAPALDGIARCIHTLDFRTVLSSTITTFVRRCPVNAASDVDERRYRARTATSPPHILARSITGTDAEELLALGWTRPNRATPPRPRPRGGKKPNPGPIWIPPK